MPELDELTTISDVNISDDDYLLLFDVAGDVAGKIRKDKLLAGLVSSGGDASLNDLTVSNLTAPSTEVTNLTFTAGGAEITAVIAVDVSLTFSSFSSGDVKSATTTISGAAIGDYVLLNIITDMPDDMSILQYGISAANTLKVRAQNVGSGTFGGATYNGKALVIRVA